ncbi:hypothetical protein A2276_04180 [candidate division WOR-1 bacterium RIFOXYA12_FULL_43_27]|uniref:Large ribosomal subunit protein bL25 n=1 Tax=candidate division WOR-1 bacterium RIFOXYC2_FULL_46_14 TaxID=1802587 RepID=A0A1F4U378_UNCSA|nr:MAG: hypothetical protein A2276_04180 [candidate division WOR-1 bacterium RIFOXYA12_FULL_43_27]OGC19112.1 MAG: hypothetical protein A2292_00155 [candidate division WOR-1 bacterium RIFOXYB2_FULL_46_45]OGC30100.1 MAG: hypothetical protein A2232_00155 [candidate division WOR-1 bacterium RIFOXYA2_FULL_46_56]OGC39341.1 MAG: hypothetical protein A2438_00155 [candidate division WOR-1 bacterium RIFOXYC2_FULL_46_14]
MEKLELKAEERKEIGKKVKHLRTKGLLPAVVYGKGYAPFHLTLNSKEYKKAISGGAGSNILLSLLVSGKEEIPVITHDIQYNAVTDQILHVDFQKIDMKEKIHTSVRIECVGVSIGVKEDGGILVQSLSELEIECLPSDIPDKVEVNVASLKIGDAIQVSDLKAMIKSGIEVVTAETETVVHVIPPTKEEEVVVAAPVTEAAVPGTENQPAAAPGQPAAAGKSAAPETPAKAPAKK